MDVTDGLWITSTTQVPCPRWTALAPCGPACPLCAGLGVGVWAERMVDGKPPGEPVFVADART